MGYPKSKRIGYHFFRSEGDAKVLVLGEQQRSRVDLTLLSAWHIALGDVPLVVKGLKSRALFLLLVMNGDRAISRKELAALLWPGQEEARARGSLRQALSELRAATRAGGQEIIRATAEDIGFENARIETDIDRLETAILNLRATDAELERVQRVADLGQAFLDIGPDFDDWLAELRARQVRRILAALERASMAQGHPAEKRLAHARAAFRLDDLNEAAVRAIMTCHAELSDNAAALSVYRDFYDRLDEELGAEPSLETQDLAVSIKLAADLAPQRDIAPAPARAVAAIQPGGRTLVAVLPFFRLGPDPIPDYLPLGMLDHITCRLASVRAPSVISSNSTRRFLDQNPEVAEVRDITGARYVVTGSLQVEGESGALAVQLAETGDGRVVWGKSMRVPRQRLFEISHDLADEIANAIEPSLNIAELERSQGMPESELEPHHLVLQAKDMMFSLRRAEFKRAKLLLDEALARGPRSAMAHALTAEWHTICLLQRWSGDPETERTALAEHSRRAIQLAPGNGRLLAMWGHNKIALDRDYDGAIRLFERAVSLLPNDAETLIWTVPTLALADHEDAALDNGLKSFELSPVDPFLFRNEHFLSLAHYAKGNFDEAARLGLSCYHRAPDFTSNLRATIASLVASGQAAQAEPLARHHNEVEPGFSANAFRDLHGFRQRARRDVFVDRLLEAGVAP